MVLSEFFSDVFFYFAGFQPPLNLGLAAKISMAGFHIWYRASLGYNTLSTMFGVERLPLNFCEKNNPNILGQCVLFQEIQCYLQIKYPLWDLFVWLWLTWSA